MRPKGEQMDREHTENTQRIQNLRPLLSPWIVRVSWPIFSWISPTVLPYILVPNIFMLLWCVYWPAHPDDPQGIRVASVIEFSVCLSVCVSAYLFLANFLIFFCSIRPLRFNKTLGEWIPMYWHRTHKTSLGVKKTIRELMPCTVGTWRCGLGGITEGGGVD